jgi:hypothetical protein
VTPRLRIPYALTVASLLLAVPVAYAEESGAPAAGPSARPDASTSLAGRQAGEGRRRPGAPEPADPGASTGPGRSPSATGRAEETGSADGLPTAPGYRPDVSHVPGTPPPAAAQKPVTRALPEPSVRPVSVLTLGAGIALIGLGLGFLGVQLRRR